MLLSAIQRRAGEIMETIQEQDLGLRGAELLDRLSHGETFEIIKDGQPVGRLMLVAPTQAEAIQQAKHTYIPGFGATPGRTFNDWLLSAPRFDDVLPPRDRSPMRDVEL